MRTLHFTDSIILQCPRCNEEALILQLLTVHCTSERACILSAVQRILVVSHNSSKCSPPLPLSFPLRLSLSACIIRRCTSHCQRQDIILSYFMPCTKYPKMLQHAHAISLARTCLTRSHAGLFIWPKIRALLKQKLCWP